MAFVIETTNPFQPLKDLVKQECLGGMTIRQWLENKYPGFIEFPVPTVCAINGTPIKREEWSERVIQPRDVVNFIAMPEGPFLIIAILIVAVIALAIFMFAAMPSAPGEPPGADPVFSVSGQQNTIRLGEPIEVCYGRNRIFPSLAARPFFKYQNNDQFQYSLFCLGQGKYHIEQILIGDTDISEYQEVTYEVLEPGQQVTLFPTTVFTAVEVGRLALLGPNEQGYVAPGWIGPFPANPAGTTATRIEFDLIFPKGLYVLNKKNNVQSIAVNVEAEARLINDAGAPLGAFFAITTPTPLTVSAATTTPQRRTFEMDVPEGRYEVRLRRTSETNLSIRAGNDTIWESLRGFVDAPQNFGNVTLMAVKIRATNNLNDRTQVRFNVIATRKLPMRVGGDSSANTDGWTDPMPTRSVMWAFVDIFRSVYGGRIFDDAFYDWTEFHRLDALYEIRNEHFDWIFRDPITVWEAARTVARVGRATPILAGSLVTMRRDEPQYIPVTMFTPENTIKGSFRWSVKLWDLDEFDSVRMEYTEVATGYKQETVLCTLPGDTTDHPQDVRFAGCQDRNHAYREGLFILATMRYLRENITIDTGLEGHITTYGDLALFSNDVPRWSQSGIVVDAEEQTSGYWLLTLSEPLEADTSGEHQILLRGKRGEVIGPLTATLQDDPQQVIIAYVPNTAETADFLLSGKTEPMMFLFGPTGNVRKYGKIIRIEPGGGEKVSITAVNYDDIIYSFDDLTAPPLNLPPTPPLPPDLPTIDDLFITQIDSVLHIVQIAWSAAFGAQRYIVQTSTDGANWEDRASTTVQTSVQLQVQTGPLWVRVAAINNGQGPWIEDDITVGEMSQLQLLGAWDDLDWKVGWWQVLEADSYQLKIYDNTDPLAPVEKHSADLNGNTRSFTYDYLDAITDSNLTRDMLVTVDAVYDGVPSGIPSRLALHNSIPSAPTGPASVFLEEASDGAHYQLSWTVPDEADLIQIKVWLSAVNNFDPGSVSPIYDNTLVAPDPTGLITTLEVTVPLDGFGAHPTQYWRVAVFDVWGSEIATNVTAQQVIAAYP